MTLPQFIKKLNTFLHKKNNYLSIKQNPPQKTSLELAGYLETWTLSYTCLSNVLLF